MARIPIIVDDLTGDQITEAQAAEFEFTFQGETYVIETTKANAAKFEKVLISYLSKAEKLDVFAKASEPTAKEYRDWALKQSAWKDKVSKKGQVAKEIKDAFHAAH